MDKRIINLSAFHFEAKRIEDGHFNLIFWGEGEKGARYEIRIKMSFSLGSYLGKVISGVYRDQIKRVQNYLIDFKNG